MVYSFYSNNFYFYFYFIFILFNVFFKRLSFEMALLTAQDVGHDETLGGLRDNLFGGDQSDTEAQAKQDFHFRFSCNKHETKFIYSRSFDENTTRGL